MVMRKRKKQNFVVAVAFIMGREGDPDTVSSQWDPARLTGIRNSAIDPSAVTNTSLPFACIFKFSYPPGKKERQDRGQERPPPLRLGLPSRDFQGEPRAEAWLCPRLLSPPGQLLSAPPASRPCAVPALLSRDKRLSGCFGETSRAMASRAERAEEAPPAGSGPLGALYRELSRFPGVTYASVGVGFAACGAAAECLPLYTEWCQPDLGRHQKLHFSRQYILHHNSRAIVSVTPVGIPAEIRDQLLIRMSPTGMHKAVFTHHLEMGQKQEMIEVWNKSGKVRSINLTSLDKHGRVYTDEQFGCVAWSSSETQILYVAERRRPKRQPLFPQSRSPQGEEPGETRKEEHFVYHDNWGEALSDKSFPVLCVVNVETSEVSVLEGIPGHISPGQALWSPDDKGILFVGWWHEPFRLGLNACSNRRSALFLFDLSESSCELLSSDSEAVSSPRLSPDGTRLLYLECPVFGPHRQCLKLQMLNWQTKLTSTVVDVVRTATSGFLGIYSGALPLLCWAADNHRVLLSTPQRSRKELLVVDTELGSVKALTEGTPEGSWTLLGIQQDLLVVSCSSPNCPPSLKVGVLPPAGCELELQWTSVEEASVLPDMEWKILTVHPPMTEDNQYTGQAFEALLLTPRGNRREEKTFPLIVSPHGGPHAVFDACWRPKMASLCQLGFAVLMVNYRGSLGFGQASIESLISHVGVQDVEDTQLAVKLALRTEPLDPDRIALLGGSHGGFVCCHLIARYPEMYKACVVRSPVINMATLLGTSDIPDWRYAVLGLPYCFERIPTEEDLTAMLLCSPIIHAAKVHTPLLMYVGAKDRRVSPYQALEYYRVLRARGIPVQLLWYPEENHAVSGMEAEADVFMNSAQWIMHYLSKEADPESQQPAEKERISNIKKQPACGDTHHATRRLPDRIDQGSVNFFSRGPVHCPSDLVGGQTIF
uniref:acylamino-acid-releasing enzyme-like isoform X2 n=1 Tax=Podarcis muralis TaxID=64176 RepID=UPI00109FF7EC|nr:acylamino-acid-releasing enzyme-like isoform X2 [Podarcis muralis]